MARPYTFESLEGQVSRIVSLIRVDRSRSFVRYSIDPDAFDVIGLAIASLRSVVVPPASGPRCCEADGLPDFVTCDPRPPQP